MTVKPYLLSIIFCSVFSAAVSAGPGESGYAFLKIGIGGQAAGMGEAVSAHVSDATAAYWNPAAMVMRPGRNISFTYNRWIEGVNHNAIAAKWTAGDHAFGLYYVYTGVDGIEQRDIPSDDPTAVFSSHDLVLGVSYARPVSRRTAVGVTSKYIYERIQSSAQAIAVDIGIWHNVRFVYDNPELDGRWRMGLSVRNLGYSGKMVNERITLPASVRFGTCYDFIRNRESKNTLTLGMEAIKPFDDGFKLAAGAEYVYRDFAALRAGYQLGYDSRSFTAGLGLKMWNRLSVDYGFMPMSNGLGTTHRVTTAFQF